MFNLIIIYNMIVPNITVKESNSQSKINLCETIKENIHNNFYSTARLSQGYFHYAIVLPSRQNSGWWEKVSYWN
jgi:hypothetical protein